MPRTVKIDEAYLDDPANRFDTPACVIVGDRVVYDPSRDGGEVEVPDEDDEGATETTDEAVDGVTGELVAGGEEPADPRLHFPHVDPDDRRPAATPTADAEPTHASGFRARWR